jgi:serine/threonine-protein kinase
MAKVYLDPMGRLVGFHDVPPQVESAQLTTPSSPQQTEWTPLFEEAGLNQAAFTSQSPARVPPFYSDNRAAWKGTFPNQPDIPITLEAASYKGRVVYFEIIGDWNQPGAMQPFQQKLGFKILNIVLLIAMVALSLIAVLLAIKNLRGGHSDRKGGGRLAIYVFAVLMISWIFRVHHYAGFEELDLFLIGVEFALFPTVVLWLCYVALEPYVRRWWPHRIVSWSRLLAGDFRDPLVGRDILIGAVFGVAIAVGGFIKAVVPIWLGRTRTPVRVNLETLLGLRESIGEFFFTTVSFILLIGLSYMFVLVVLYMIFRRRDWLVSLVAWLMVTVLFGLNSRNLIPSLLFSAGMSALLLVVATRFGLLALIAAAFFLLLLTTFPMTTDFSVWYASSTIFAITAGLALASYAAYVSLAGQQVFKGELLRE